MPFNPANASPGVYIQEIPSGVRTITGVATSITVFFGLAKRGPVNEAIHIFNLKGYEDTFGGLSADSDMSYAVRQFFLNGGNDAWIVRLAKNAHQASLDLKDSAGNVVITVTAVDEGEEGNNIQLQVDDPTSDKTIAAGRFNLLLSYASKDNPTNGRTEVYKGLSMDPRDPLYVLDTINDVSQLVTVSTASQSTNGAGTSTALVPLRSSMALVSLQPGKLITGQFAAGELDTLPDAQHNGFKIGLDGHPASTVVNLDPTPLGKNDLDKQLSDLATRIQKAVRAAKPGLPAWRGFTCAVSSDNKLVLASGTMGAGSAVDVADVDAGQNSIYKQLHFDQKQAVAGSIPNPPVALHSEPGKLTSGQFTTGELDTLPDAQHNSFKIGFNGNSADTPVSIDAASSVGNKALEDQLKDMASRIQKAVRAAKPGLPAWSGFTCTVSSDKKALVFASGTSDANSSVEVADVGANQNSIFSELHLDAKATATAPGVPDLAGGTADPFDLNKGLDVFFPDRSTPEGSRSGIYALDEVDLFNLLCLPGVTDPGILTNAIAYCKERRAFLIADPDPNLNRDGMVKFITDSNLPKGDLGTYAAIYFPWIKVPDPLNNGKLTPLSPCGTIAGIYARTDATRGVWKAPAGTDATLIGVRALDTQLIDAENGVLNSLGVNCLRTFPLFGGVSWGARTVSGADDLSSEYKYVPIRRLALYIEESLYRGTKWVVFEPNDEPLWAQIRLNVGAFMHNLFVKGAFQGATPKEAYFVKCDKETTTQNDIDLGIVNILVGFAPLKPAEFVVISLQQIAGQLLV
jgi:phage tail sheath protein FI